MSHGLLLKKVKLRPEWPPGLFFKGKRNRWWHNYWALERTGHWTGLVSGDWWYSPLPVRANSSGYSTYEWLVHIRSKTPQRHQSGEADHLLGPDPSISAHYRHQIKVLDPTIEALLKNDRKAWILKLGSDLGCRWKVVGLGTKKLL